MSWWGEWPVLRLWRVYQEDSHDIAIKDPPARHQHISVPLQSWLFAGEDHPGPHQEKVEGRSWRTPAPGRDEKVPWATWWAARCLTEWGLKWWNAMLADKEWRRKSGKLGEIPPAFCTADVCPLLSSLPCLDYRILVSCSWKMAGEMGPSLQAQLLGTSSTFFLSSCGGRGKTCKFRQLWNAAWKASIMGGSVWVGKGTKHVQ